LHAHTMGNGPPSAKFPPPWLKRLDTPLTVGGHFSTRPEAALPDVGALNVAKPLLRRNRRLSYRSQMRWYFTFFRCTFQLSCRSRKTSELSSVTVVFNLGVLNHFGGVVSRYCMYSAVVHLLYLSYRWGSVSYSWLI